MPSPLNGSECRNDPCVYRSGGKQSLLHKPCILTPPTPRPPPEPFDLMDNNGTYRTIASLSAFVTVFLCSGTSVCKDFSG